jgi:hypothetical protein
MTRCIGRSGMPQAFQRAAQEGKAAADFQRLFQLPLVPRHAAGKLPRRRVSPPYINRQFIPVKIDRELLPAVDAGLIDFARRTRGQAGWPLHVVLTPEGHPLVARYCISRPRHSKAFLHDLAARWEAEGPALTAVARAAARQSAATPPAMAGSPEPGALARALRTDALAQADELAGGFGAQSKFPKAPQLLALLHVQAQTPQDALEEFLRLTLDQMAGQGLRDHSAADSSATPKTRTGRRRISRRCSTTMHCWRVSTCARRACSMRRNISTSRALPWISSGNAWPRRAADITLRCRRSMRRARRAVITCGTAVNYKIARRRTGRCCDATGAWTGRRRSRPDTCRSHA